MENRAHALAAGRFTLLLGAALGVVALWFSKDELKLIPYVMSTTNSVTGLKVEAPVRYRGVDVGKVDAISIDAANGGRVQIRIHCGHLLDANSRVFSGSVDAATGFNSGVRPAGGIFESWFFVRRG